MCSFSPKKKSGQDREITSHFHWFFLQYFILKSKNLIHIMPRLAETGASPQARARENGTSPLMKRSSSPKFLSLGLLFPKTSCLDKGMRKGEKQSFKKTLNYFSGQLSKSASHSRVKKCFCLTFQHTPSLNWIATHSSDWVFKTENIKFQGQTLFCI